MTVDTAAVDAVMQGELAAAEFVDVMLAAESVTISTGTRRCSRGTTSP